MRGAFLLDKLDRHKDQKKKEPARRAPFALHDHRNREGEPRFATEQETEQGRHHGTTAPANDDRCCPPKVGNEQRAAGRAGTAKEIMARYSVEGT